MVVICISSIRFMCGWVNRTEERRGSAAGAGCFGTNCPKVQAYKNARTAWRYAGARNITVIIVLIYFMLMSRILRCGAWAFFDRRLLGELQNIKMDTAIPSYGPPWGYWISKEKRRLWKLSRRFMGAWKCVCCTTAFFLLPSCGRLLIIYNFRSSVMDFNAFNLTGQFHLGCGKTIF